MRRAIILTVFLAMLSGNARALVHLTADPSSFESCWFSVPTGFTQFFVIHRYSSGAAGSRFNIDESGAPGTVLLAFSSPYAYTGLLGHEQIVTYGDCLYGSFTVATVDAFVACGELAMSSAFETMCAGGEFDSHNPYTGALCACTMSTRCCFTLATEPTTWGSVKALYR